MSESRQLAAIVFSDISGFTHTMESDENRAMAQIQKHREIVTNVIQEFNGEMLKEMGDGILLKFTSAIEAVHCAIQIQTHTETENFNLKIGIHLGDIIIKDNDIFGSGVNIASRIHEHGSPGSICISNEIWLQIKNQPDINANSLGKKKLKGVDGEIEIYQLDVGIKNETKTNGVKEKSSPQTEASTKTNLNIYTITGGALAVIGIMFWFFFSTSSLSTADEGLIENSIAVFEFENLSEEGETSRMGEILQHLIISDLSGLTHLKVISHQRLQDIQKQNSEGVENYTIAQQANAKVLLSGSIMELSGKKYWLGI